jgi:hypothetical protein
MPVEPAYVDGDRTLNCGVDGADRCQDVRRWER